MNNRILSREEVIELLSNPVNKNEIYVLPMIFKCNNNTSSTIRKE